MKMNRIILSLWLFLAGGVALTSCTKNDATTISLIGTEYYIDDILSVIPDSLEARFLSDFGSIPDGPVPPKIEGSYMMNPKQRVSSNVAEWPLQAVEPNVYLRFSKQHNGIVTMDLNEATETKTDTVFVCGNSNAFTVYFIENKAYDVQVDNHTYHVRMKRGIIMKGAVSDRGLSNFRYATIIMETEDDSGGLIGQYENGSYFIYKDGDGTAENQEW
jgi:hypothetical protein